MPSKNKPGCICCQDPFCCDGTIPATLDIELDSVAGTGINNYCPDTSCANSYNNAPGGITLSRAGDSCTWGATEVVDPICGNPANGCFLPGYREWVARIFEDGNGDWKLTVSITTYEFTGAGWAIATEVVGYEHDFGAFRPLCGTLSGTTLTSTLTSSCCDFAAATMSVV